MSNKFNVTDYLTRIKCNLEVTATPQYLKKLHRSHLLHIPFENLDNFLGNQVRLDISRIYNKIILHRRGGFCYELNGLFFELLIKLGFQAHLISARVRDSQGIFGPEFDHMAILVYFENEVYLADVGFGFSFKNPKKMEPGELQMDYNRYFKILKNIDDEYMLQSSEDAVEFTDQYIFTTKKRTLVEFLKMCEFHHLNPKSHMTKKLFVTQATKEGQVTLTDKNLTISKLGTKEKIRIQNLDDFKVKLLQHFRIRYRRNR